MNSISVLIAGQGEKESEMYRVYQCDSTIPNDPKPHTFVEIEKDGFVEIAFRPAKKLTPAEKTWLRACVRITRKKERQENAFHIRMARRYLNLITGYNEVELRLLGTF